MCVCSVTDLISLCPRVFPYFEARFLLNNVAVSQADYQSKLEGINILYKVRNFLVFQGDVEATAQRQGKDLTAFFEHISGSDAFRQEYERLGAEKAKKEDQARFLFTKKRNAINEKKRVSQQKAEADEYQQLEGERVNLQREFYLFRLHGVERQISDVSSKRAVVAEERAGVKADLKRGAETSDGVDRRRAQEHLAANQAWRAVGTIRTKVEKATTEHTAASSRLAFLRQRIELIEATEEKDTRRQSQLEEQVIALEAQRADISHESRKLAARVAQHEVRFTTQQRTEFDSAQRESERITATRSDRARELEHQIQSAAADRTHAERDQREMTAVRDHLKIRIAELTEERDAAKAKLGMYQRPENGFQVTRARACRRVVCIKLVLSWSGRVWLHLPMSLLVFAFERVLVLACFSPQFYVNVCF